MVAGLPVVRKVGQNLPWIASFGWLPDWLEPDVGSMVAVEWFLPQAVAQ